MEGRLSSTWKSVTLSAPQARFAWQAWHFRTFIVEDCRRWWIHGRREDGTSSRSECSTVMGMRLQNYSSWSMLPDLRHLKSTLLRQRLSQGPVCGVPVCLTVLPTAGTLDPDWISELWWLHLETPIVESSESIERKFLRRDHRNLTDKFAKTYERDALWPDFRRAQK